MGDVYISGNNVLGSEILDDPNFNSEPAWSGVGTGWGVAGGTATATATTNSLTDGVSLTQSDAYRIEYAIATHSGGNFSIDLAGNPEDGIKTAYFNLSGEVPRSYVIDQVASSLGRAGFNAQASLTATFTYLSIKHQTTSGTGDSIDPYIGLYNNFDYSTLSPGDTVYIGGNVTLNTLILDGVVGTAAAPITIKALPDLVWNNYSTSYQTLAGHGITLNNCSYVNIEGITINGDNHLNTDIVSGSTTVPMSSHGIIIDENNDYINNVNITFNCSGTDT